MAWIVGLSLPTLLDWGLRGLELVPSGLEAGGRRKAPVQSWAGLLVVLPSAVLVLRNQASVVADCEELEAVLEGLLCRVTAALVATVSWPGASAQDGCAVGLWAAGAGGVSAGERSGVGWSPQRR
ncbi:hypothetical protein NDU88_002788 [Pleurodeles waltl]|uniref:Uncharacterized protein n=1 Tax=Pleurodeles waltl TaxID=8319 RepID=A0AAV7PAC9_PLEWA|nr:hypothetical protein NDU88_002788 [Pleurodeles waltl]